MPIDNEHTDPLPGLTPGAIEELAGAWEDDGLWPDVLWLADAVWNAGYGELAVRWHHLVLAVGNFKRQRNRRLQPPTLVDGAASHQGTSDVLVTPGSYRLFRDDPQSWRGLDIRGAAVATTTTLLAALWPEHHFIFDWRVRAAANGLRLHAGLPVTAGIDADRRSAATITLDDYATVRQWVLDTGAPILHVERALYELSRRSRGTPGRTWQQYSKVVRGQVDEAYEKSTAAAWARKNS